MPAQTRVPTPAELARRRRFAIRYVAFLGHRIRSDEDTPLPQPLTLDRDDITLDRDDITLDQTEE